MYKEWEKIAAKMLEIDPAELASKFPQLYQRIWAINYYVGKCGGFLRSRQVIASVVAEFAPKNTIIST